jgi:biopolymer transport protein ExbD
MIKLNNSNPQKAEINITPLTDVMMVLVLILLITAPFLSIQGMKVKLPTATTKELDAEKIISITYTLDKKILLGKNEIPTVNLLNQYLLEVLKTHPTKNVIVNADENVPYGEVVTILDIAKGSGAERVALATINKKKI